MGNLIFTMTNVSHFAVIGQSENAIGWASASVLNTSGTYPALLPGADAEIVISGHNSSSGSPVHVTLDQAAIDGKSVNPGFVAMANLWHTATGQPLRLTDINDSGTSMAMMMDNEDATRDGTIDDAAVAEGTTRFGPVTDVFYTWWNSEAAAAKTLWESRSAHFFGINSDGTDYDFATGDLDKCLIDTSGRGFGMLPSSTKVHMFMPGVRVEGHDTLIDPPLRNYRTDAAGASVYPFMVQSNEHPAYQERIDFLADVRAANRGNALSTPALVRFGDYTGGARNAGSAQVNTHPGLQDRDGQILYSQDVCAGFLMAKEYITVPVFDRAVWASDGSHVDFIFSIPDGGTLTTQRIRNGETVASPRPHQQEVMGFVLRRSGDTEATERPIYRTDNTDEALYPTDYRGTIVIHNTGSGTPREAVVRITPVTPFANGDTVWFGEDGGYGSFNLHGHPDYDARLYRDGLRVYHPDLDDGSATAYPGVPVRNQVSATASGVAGVDLFSDDFSTDTSGNWTIFRGDAGLLVTGGEATSSGGGTDNFIGVHQAISGLGDNRRVEFTLGGGDGSVGSTHFFARVTDIDNHVRILITDQVLQITKEVADFELQGGSQAHTPQIGNVYALVIENDTATVEVSTDGGATFVAQPGLSMDVSDVPKSNEIGFRLRPGALRLDKITAETLP